MKDFSRIQLGRTLEEIRGLLSALRHDMDRGEAKGVESDLRCLEKTISEAKRHYEEIFKKETVKHT